MPENGGNAPCEVWGTYEHSCMQTDDGWRADGMSFFATADRGDDFVRNTPGNLGRPNRTTYELNSGDIP